MRASARSFNLSIRSRGPWGFDCAITDEEWPVFVTAFPDKAAEYDAEDRKIVCRIREPLPKDLMERLRKSRLFAQAYDVGGLTPAGFNDFLPVRRTQDAFVQAWEELEAYVQA